MKLLDTLRGWLFGHDTGDGLGQSMITDVIWLLRFRRVSKQAITWQAPAEAERLAWEQDPVHSRFGNFLIAVADIGQWRCWITERIFSGWPDPPTFAFIARGKAGEVWAAVDFAEWPACWHKPEGME